MDYSVLFDGDGCGCEGGTCEPSTEEEAPATEESSDAPAESEAPAAE